MTIVYRTVTYSYKVFSPGERVRPCSHHCPIPNGTYVVDRCEAPGENDPHDSEPVLFVFGQRFGLSTWYFEPAPTD